MQRRNLGVKWSQVQKCCQPDHLSSMDTELTLAFAVGDRVKIAENTGYSVWATPPVVFVDVIGCVGPHGIDDEYIRKLNPWPIPLDEIEHAD